MNYLTQFEHFQIPILEIWKRTENYYDNITKSNINCGLNERNIFQKEILNESIEDMLLHGLSYFRNMTIMFMMNMNFSCSKQYFRDYLSDRYSMVAIKEMIISKDMLKKILFQLHYDGFHPDVFRTIISNGDFFENHYDIYKKMVRDNIPSISCTYIVVLKKYGILEAETVRESEYAIYVPHDDRNKWILGTICLNRNTFMFLEYQNFDFFFKPRDIEYERTRHRMNHFRNFYFDLPVIDRSQIMIFSSMILYFLGHRNATDIDVMSFHVNPDTHEKLLDLHERHGIKNHQEKNENHFYDLKVKNTDLYPHYWDSDWLDRWARCSGKKYFKEVIGNGKHHCYFLGVKMICIEMDLQRRIERYRPNSIADLISFQMRYHFYPFQIPLFPETVIEYKRIDKCSPEDIVLYRTNHVPFKESTQEFECSKPQDYERFCILVKEALYRRYKIDIDIRDVKDKIRRHVESSGAGMAASNQRSELMIESPNQILSRKHTETNTSKVVRMINESREKTESFREMMQHQEVQQTETKKKRIIRKRMEDNE